MIPFLYQKKPPIGDGPELGVTTLLYRGCGLTTETTMVLFSTPPNPRLRPDDPKFIKFIYAKEEPLQCDCYQEDKEDEEAREEEALVVEVPVGEELVLEAPWWRCRYASIRRVGGGGRLLQPNIVSCIVSHSCCAYNQSSGLKPSE
jgi:hypothetical protein